MVTITLTANLRRHAPVESVEVEATTVREALEALFANHPRLRGYLLDDQGAVRKHVTLFVDREPIADRRAQSDATPDGCEVYIAQALSGG